MEQKIAHVNGVIIAVIKSNELIITNGQSALDLLTNVFFNENCQHIALYKKAIIEDFFDLKTGVAGEILQKFTNFKMKLAIIGDFSGYSSKALTDFIYECNRGNQIFFVADEQDALEKLARAV